MCYFKDNWDVQPATRAYFQLLQRALAFGQRLFLPFGQKRALMLFVLILGHFCCSVVSSLMFSSDLSNFKKNHKKKYPQRNLKKSRRIQKFQKNPYAKKKNIPKVPKKNPKKSKSVKNFPKIQISLKKKHQKIFFF